MKILGFDYGENSPIHTAAVCVYPAKVEAAYSALEKAGFASKINVASGKYSFKIMWICGSCLFIFYDL